MIFSKNITLFLVSVALHAGAATCAEYGSWSIHVRITAGAQGHRRGDLYANHTMTPATTTHAVWVYNPETQVTTYTPDDATLNNTLIERIGLQTFEIQQTVLGISLKGAGTIDMVFSPGGSGRGGEGSTTILSELDD